MSSDEETKLAAAADNTLLDALNDKRVGHEQKVSSEQARVAGQQELSGPKSDEPVEKTVDDFDTLHFDVSSLSDKLSDDSAQVDPKPKLAPINLIDSKIELFDEQNNASSDSSMENAQVESESDAVALSEENTAPSNPAVMVDDVAKVEIAEMQTLAVSREELDDSPTQASASEALAGDKTKLEINVEPRDHSDREQQKLPAFSVPSEVELAGDRTKLEINIERQHADVNDAPTISQLELARQKLDNVSLEELDATITNKNQPADAFGPTFRAQLPISLSQEAHLEDTLASKVAGLEERLSKEQDPTWVPKDKDPSQTAPELKDNSQDETLVPKDAIHAPQLSDQESTLVANENTPSISNLIDPASQEVTLVPPKEQAAVADTKTVDPVVESTHVRPPSKARGQSVQHFVEQAAPQARSPSQVSTPPGSQSVSGRRGFGNNTLLWMDSPREQEVSTAFSIARFFRQVATAVLVLCGLLIVSVLVFLGFDKFERGVVEVHTVPPGALISLDGTETTYKTPVRLTMGLGAHSVLLRLNGHKDYELNFYAKSGKQQRHDIHLEPISKTGLMTVTITVSPVSAQLMLNGRSYGISQTFKIADVHPEKVNVLQLKAGGYRSVKLSVEKNSLKGSYNFVLQSDATADGQQADTKNRLQLAGD